VSIFDRRPSSFDLAGILPGPYARGMKAIVISEFGGPENLVIRDLPTPSPQPGDVLVRVRAFGINRAETYMRRGEWPEIAPVSGIECVGEVEFDPSGALTPGTKVAAVMGGMGRTRNGSYAQFVAVPATNVAALQTELAWAVLAAVPESYATAWSVLNLTLKLAPKETLLVRGATSALGQACVNLGSALGANVFATTRREARRGQLEARGAKRVFIENDGIDEAVRAVHPEGVDAIADLIGNTALRSSLGLSRLRSGRVCVAGFLGGVEPVAFDALTALTPGVALSLYASFAIGTRAYPLAEVPLAQIVDDVAAKRYDATPAAVFPFERISDAHRLMESNEANGKIVVTLDG
jgi:NADPH2:quinone reductase